MYIFLHMHSLYVWGYRASFSLGFKNCDVKKKITKLEILRCYRNYKVRVKLSSHSTKTRPKHRKKNHKVRVWFSLLRRKNIENAQQKVCDSTPVIFAPSVACDNQTEWWMVDGQVGHVQFVQKLEDFSAVELTSQVFGVMRTHFVKREF